MEREPTVQLFDKLHFNKQVARVKVYLGGDEIIPQSSTPYLIVQWDPFLEPVYHVSGQWDVVILANINGTNPSVVAGWNGIGTGFIYPNPGDRINVTVTYDPSTNTLSGVATDLNTGQSVSFTLSLSGNFTPPSSGNYVFGIGAGTGWGYADWALLYVAMIGNVKSPSPSPTYYSVNFTEVGLPPGTAWNVTLNGVTETSSSSSIVFTVPNGEYSYSVASPILVNGVEYVATEPTGTVAVNNANVTVTVQYVPATPPTPSRSSLAVQVFNVNNRPATSVPGVVYGVLYSSSGFEALAYMNSSGYLNFNNLTPGTYTLEVYHYPNTGLNLTEYWGNATIAVQAGYNGYAFTRHEPWIYDLQPMAGSGQIAVNVTVDNPLGNAVQGEVELWVTSNPSTASPYAPSAVRYVTLNPGLNTFTISYPVSQAGTYYVYAAVSAMISQYLPTDQRNWTLIEQQISQYTTTTTSTEATTATTTSITTTATTATTATQTVQPSVQTATTATGASGIQPPPLVVVPTPQSTANGQTRQIGALQIATWALVGVAAFLLAYLLSGFVLSRKP